MTQFIVATPSNFVPFQIDEGEFREGSQRSCKGSLHVRPGATLTISADEFSVLKARLPGVAIRSKRQDVTPVSAVTIVEEKPAVVAPKPRRTEKTDDRK